MLPQALNQAILEMGKLDDGRSAEVIAVQGVQPRLTPAPLKDNSLHREPLERLSHPAL